MRRFLKRLAELFLGHDYEMEFPDKERPLDCQYRCRRCGRVTRNIFDAI